MSFSDLGLKILNKMAPYAASVALVVVTTFFGEFFKRSFEPTNLVMLYLLAVVISAIWWGTGPAILTSILSVLAFDFFIVPPYLTFAVADLQYVVTFASLLIVGVVISTLASKAREQLLRRETEKLQTALLNSISHDLKTPLVSITGALTTLLQDGSLRSQETDRELLETAYEGSDRLNRLVGNLLDMTRIEAGALKCHRGQCELRDLIGASLRQLKEKTDGREILVHIPSDLPEVLVDFSLMMRVIVNVVDNALKYSPSDAPIEIAARLSGDRLRLEVKDRGFGVPEEDLHRIFDKFYRTVRPEQVTGTGLGLSICKGIVEAHHGKIWAENGPDKGLTLVMILPLADENGR